MSEVGKVSTKNQPSHPSKPFGFSGHIFLCSRKKANIFDLLTPLRFPATILKYKRNGYHNFKL